MTYPAAAHHDEEHLLAAARLIDLLESSAPDAIGQQLRDFGQGGYNTARARGHRHSGSGGVASRLARRSPVRAAAHQRDDGSRHHAAPG
jgi:hypothetical protein